MVAGVSSLTNNGKGQAGVNYAGHLIPIRVFDAPCKTRGARAAWIRKAVTLGAQVVNAGAIFEGYDKRECKAIRNAWNKGTVVVVPYAYRPSLSSSFWPGRCALALTTTMMDEKGKVSDKAVQDSSVRVAAPGVKVRRLSAAGGYDLAPSGTSIAAPHVSGLVHLLRALGVPNNVAFQTAWNSATPMSTCPGKCGGKINMWRAMKSSLPNGVMELWPASLDKPDTWKRDGTCSSPAVSRSSANITYGGSYSMATRCNGSGLLDVHQTVLVTNGWTYRLTARARLSSSGSIDPHKMKMQVCFYNAQNVRFLPCPAQYGDDAGVDRSWKVWSFLAPAPAGAVKARVVLRTIADTQDGSAIWDDIGFYAFGRPS